MQNDALKTCAAAGLVNDAQGHKEIYLEDCKPNNSYQRWTYNPTAKQLKNDALKTCAAAGLVNDAQGHKEIYLEDCKPNNSYQQWTFQ
ncbi:MAG: ricin-type beta-trefoil lectin domain protein [Pseudonocardiaceae bacterium]